MASFLINTKTELLKSRRTLAYWIAFLSAIALPVMLLLAYALRPDVFVPRQGAEPWVMHIRNCWEMPAAFFPMFVTVLTSLVVQTEYKNNTWKLIYTLPRSYGDIFFSKFIVIQLLLLGSMLVFNLAVLATGSIASLLNGDYAFLSTAPPFSLMFSISAKVYVSSLCIAAIQYWLSLRFRNYVASMGIGMGLNITTFIIVKWDKIIYFPYAYPFLTYFKGGEGIASNGLARHEWYSIIGLAVVLLLSYWDIQRRKERG